MTLDPRTGATLLSPSQAQKEVAVNEIFTLLSVLAAGGTLAIVNTPPASPVNGQSWIIGNAPTGVFAARPRQIAYYLDGWKFVTPWQGLLTYVAALTSIYCFDNGAWIVASAGGNVATPVDGVTPGLVFDWAVATAVPPLSGQLRADSTNYTAIANLFVHESDRNTVNIASVLSLITAGSILQIQSTADPAKYAWFSVTSIADNGAYRTIAVTYLTHAGTFANGEDVSLSISRRGADGAGIVGQRKQAAYAVTTTTNGQIENGLITLESKAVQIFRISATQTIDVVIYADSASRSADTRVDLVNDTLPDVSWVIAEGRASSGSPAIARGGTIGINLDDSLSYPIRVINRSGLATTVTIDYITVQVP